MQIRDSVMDDLPFLLEIYNQSVRNSAATFDLEEQTLAQRTEWFSHYGGRYPLIVAQVQDQVVGYASLSKFREKPAYQYTAECSVYIHDRFHGQGIGRALMNDLLSRTSKLGYHSIVAGITDGNEASMRLHESLGFQYVGCLREVGFKFQQWQHVHYYQYFVR
ncbi:GNAT family N-acetyltransferase [Alicyclobacillus fastidiosus]|nr:GNAT family N-acetyltransferase [Alicyclobacillus fastidiosus]GMA65402.1 N-acetyltransferase [Alicyclobacillus fastidiosus]